MRIRKPREKRQRLFFNRQRYKCLWRKLCTTSNCIFAFAKKNIHRTEKFAFHTIQQNRKNSPLFQRARHQFFQHIFSAVSAALSHYIKHINAVVKVVSFPTSFQCYDFKADNKSWVHLARRREIKHSRVVWLDALAIFEKLGNIYVGVVMKVAYVIVIYFGFISVWFV